MPTPILTVKTITFVSFMAITVSLLMLPPVLQAEDFTTLEGDHYSNATIKKVDPDGLLIAYPDGVVKLKFKKLPPAIGVQ